MWWYSKETCISSHIKLHYCKKREKEKWKEVKSDFFEYIYLHFRRKPKGSSWGSFNFTIPNRAQSETLDNAMFIRFTYIRILQNAWHEIHTKGRIDLKSLAVVWNQILLIYLNKSFHVTLWPTKQTILFRISKLA